MFIVHTKLYLASFLQGDIHTQVATEGLGLLTLTLELWQNDIFLILM